MCGEGRMRCKCRAVGFLLGLPFALLAMPVVLLGIVIWLFGVLLNLVCSCFVCVTVIIETGVECMRAPLQIMTWFLNKIPC